MVLTKNWQKVAETYLGNTGYGDVYIRCYAKYNSQSIENNTTNVDVESRIYLSRGTFYSNSGTTAWATISGDSASAGANGSYSAGEKTVASKNKTITHNDDGTKSISVSSRWQSQPWGWDNTASTNVDLPKIDRYPMFISAPDFSDEDDATITYTTVLGFTGATVEAGIFDSTGTTAYASYRPIVVDNGSYTFELTNEERTALRNATPNSNTMNVMFKLRTTTTGSVEYFSTSVKQLRIVNANPTMTYTITETNQKVIDLLGTSANTIIENVSLLNFDVVPTTYKGASVKQVLCGNRYDYLNRKSKTTSPYSIDIPVKSENTFLIVVYDSRDNLVQDIDIQKTMIEYQPVDITSFSFKRVNPTSANILVSLEATYYQETFGSTTNVPIVKWKLEDGSWNTIPSTEYTIDTTNNKLTITNYQLTNALDYRQSGQFYISIEDLLTTDQESGGNGYVLKGIPTFDAGEHDFKVNGDLYVADQDAQNKVNILDEINTKVSSYNLETGGSAVKTGRKIDNKDEYVEKINAGAGPNNTTKFVNYSHTDKIIQDFYLIGISSTDETIKAPNSAGSSSYFNIYFEATRIAIGSNQDRSRFNCYIYIYYTYK